MNIDLAELRQMHRRLPSDLALIIIGRAALALERNSHKSGANISLDLERTLGSCMLYCPAADLSEADQHDTNRITEDGAEAVALAIAHRYRAWHVIRRMQREEHGDWLLEETRGNRRRVIALEVSGVNRGGIAARLSEKLAQVAKSVDADQRWAGVVGFEQPTIALHFNKRNPHG